MIFRRIHRGLLCHAPPLSFIRQLLSPLLSIPLSCRLKSPSCLAITVMNAAIERPVLKYPIKTMDNSQGKCGRYKVKLRPIAHWSDDIIALSHVMNNSMRRRIAVAPNDNSNGKSSRFKGFAIVRVQTQFLQSIEYAIACIPPPFSSFVNHFCNEITMTPPMPSGIQFKSHAYSPSILCTNTTLHFPPASSTSFRPIFFRVHFNSQHLRLAMRVKCFRPAM